VLGVRCFLHIHGLTATQRFQHVGIESIVGWVFIGEFIPGFKTSVGEKGGFRNGWLGTVWFFRIFVRVVQQRDRVHSEERVG